MSSDTVLPVLVVINDHGDAAATRVTTVSVRAQDGVEAKILDTVDGLALSSGDPTPLLWIEAGTILADNAIARFLRVCQRFEAELVYADGTVAVGGRRTPLDRPDFSPLRLLAHDYLGDAILFSASRAREVAGSTRLGRGVVDEAALLADPARVVHIPERLTRRSDAGVAIDLDTRLEIVRARLAAGGVAAEVEVETYTSLRIRFAPVGAPLVSIVIPTRGSSAEIRGRRSVLVVDAVRTILETSTYPCIEIVVVADDATPQSVVDELVRLAGERLTLARWSGPFNFSSKINRGAAHATGDYLLILNDDVEVITPDWIETMLGLCQQPGVGMVGAHLVFEDGTVQHGGHFYRARGAGHIAFGWSAADDEALSSLSVDHEVSGVTAACALVSTELFTRVGGFSALLPGNFNDVDFSFKVRSTGARIVWTPWARLFHFESKTRTPTSVDSEFERLRSRWGTRMEVDPYWAETGHPVG